MVTSNLLTIYVKHKDSVHRIWEAKLNCFYEKRNEILKESSMDIEHSSGSKPTADYDGLLKLNLILSKLGGREKALEEVIGDLVQLHGVLSAVVALNEREEMHFFVIYLILELQAICQDEEDMRLRLKSLISDLRNELKVSQDVLGYFQGLFRLDELLIPQDETDLKSMEHKLKGIVQYSLK